MWSASQIGHKGENTQVLGSDGPDPNPSLPLAV